MGGHQNCTKNGAARSNSRSGELLCRDFIGSRIPAASAREQIIEFRISSGSHKKPSKVVFNRQLLVTWSMPVVCVSGLNRKEEFHLYFGDSEPSPQAPPTSTPQGQRACHSAAVLQAWHDTLLPKATLLHEGPIVLTANNAPDQWNYWDTQLSSVYIQN